MKWKTWEKKKKQHRRQIQSWEKASNNRTSRWCGCSFEAIMYVLVSLPPYSGQVRNYRSTEAITCVDDVWWTCTIAVSWNCSNAHNVIAEMRSFPWRGDKGVGDFLRCCICNCTVARGWILWANFCPECSGTYLQYRTSYSMRLECYTISI